jgi:hypothetical protein
MVGSCLTAREDEGYGSRLDPWRYGSWATFDDVIE